MEPNQFRETRLRITKLCDDIILYVDKKDADASKDALEKANKLLAALTPEAAGEIQKRSVKNLGLKIKVAKTLANKIKPGKSSPKKSQRSAPKEKISWTEDRLGTLSENYLTKVLANMDSGKESNVRFCAIGKGVRPSYQIDPGDQDAVAFSGSGHKPLKRRLGDNKLSPPFSQAAIKSILERK